MKVRVYGPGCANCTKTEELVRDVLARLNIAAEVEKVRDLKEIAEAGVFGTPAVSVDGEIKISGRMPREAEIESWFTK